MSKKRIVNPFFPNLPIKDPRRFIGRKNQLDAAIDSMFQIANNNPKHTIITGDRGIGKSSFLLQLMNISQGDNTLPELFNLDLGIPVYNFEIAWHDCDDDQKPIDIVKGLLSDFNSNLETFLSGLKIKLNLAGIAEIEERSIDEKSISELVAYFVNELKKLNQAAEKRNKTGILLFIDELDRVDSSSGFATFFKLTAERLNRENLPNVCFFCGGISGAVQELRNEHASIDRTFTDIPIPKLSENEAFEIISTALLKINYKAENEIFEAIYNIADGFPEPLHVIGSEIVNVAQNETVTMSDFNVALANVVMNVKRNKLKDILERAGYGKYQQILKAMASSPETNVAIKYISQKLGLKQNEYSTNIGVLRDRQIIMKVDRGIYRFTEPLLKEYIKHFGVIETAEEEK